jgi:CDP-glucose 4,6-dehydratase
VLEPLHGYLVLAKKLFFEQKKYSGPYNFGPSTTSILNVKSVVEKIIKIWGSGKLKVIKKKNEPKEQQILQLNIDKSIQVLKWKPIYSLAETILVTVFWYKQVFFYKNNPIDITAKQILEYQKNIK